MYVCKYINQNNVIKYHDSYVQLQKIKWAM